MKIIIGSYEKVKDRCLKIFPGGYYDFNFLYVSENERFREIDRFLYESRHLLRFKNEYTGNVVIDISEWNNKILNRYFDAFMFFVKDNLNRINCVFVINEKCNDELIAKLKSFFNIEQVLLQLPKEQPKVKIGFAINEEKEEKRSNVRS